MNIFETIEKLCAVPAVSGFEHAASRRASIMLNHYTDKVSTDAFGNVFGVRYGQKRGGMTLLLDAHIDELRAVYQVATSPVYGDRMREAAENLQPVYHKYIKKLSELTCCSEELLLPTVFNFISVILDYAVWNDRPVTELQLKDIYNTIVFKVKMSMSGIQEV